MSERPPRRRDPAGKPVHPAPPADVAEALGRARDHTRRAVAESASALRALLDAASLAATGAPSDARRGLAQAARLLDEVAAGLGGESGAPVLRALADALDAEISRWEARASEDPDARAVLRAWLGLRELLWELGIRREPRAASARESGPAAGASQRSGRRSPRGRGLERVRLDS